MTTHTEKSRNNIIDISICIPTFNRASLLSQCINHLLSFTAFTIEIIVGDNASSDNTENLVKKISKNNNNIIYHRHSKNIGFARNMDAILRLASGEYIYILSDDDMVYENALLLMKNILDTTPSAVGINGQYLSTDDANKKAVEGYINNDNKDNYKDVKILLFQKGSFIDLINNVLICDGHPLMRRSIFQQYCMYNDRSFCLTPLYFKLLSLGDILHIKAPIFQHFRNGESLTTNMTDHWFIDYINSDIETSLADIMHLIPDNTTEILRRKMLGLVYFQAARMARLSNNFSLMWSFLKRLKAIQGINEECLVKCEYHFLFNVVIERILLIAKDTDSKNIFFEDTPLMEQLMAQLMERTKQAVDKNNLTINFHLLSTKNKTKQKNEFNNLVILQTYNNNLINKYNITNVISFIDLVKSQRLTLQEISINNDGHSIKILFPDEEIINAIKKQSKSFDLLNIKYANDKSNYQ